jgi:hypothetical protein
VNVLILLGETGAGWQSSSDEMVVRMANLAVAQYRVAETVE